MRSVSRSATRSIGLRQAGTAYADLAVRLLTDPAGSDGYETVWFYQRLSAACTRHEVKQNAT